MPDSDPIRLTPFTTDEVEFALSFALRFDGRKAYKRADESMARIVASHMAEHLHRSNFFIYKGPPGALHWIGVSPD